MLDVDGSLMAEVPELDAVHYYLIIFSRTEKDQKNYDRKESAIQQKRPRSFYLRKVLPRVLYKNTWQRSAGTLLLIFLTVEFS